MTSTLSPGQFRFHKAGDTTLFSKQRSDDQRRCAGWSSAPDRDCAVRDSAKRKPLMLRASASQLITRCLRRRLPRRALVLVRACSERRILEKLYTLSDVWDHALSQEEPASQSSCKSKGSLSPRATTPQAAQQLLGHRDPTSLLFYATHRRRAPTGQPPHGGARAASRAALGRQHQRATGFGALDLATDRAVSRRERPAPRPLPQPTARAACSTHHPCGEVRSHRYLTHSATPVASIPFGPVKKPCGRARSHCMFRAIFRERCGSRAGGGAREQAAGGGGVRPERQGGADC
jgi:hypothetical protein